MRVYKYEIQARDLTSVRLPLGAEILSVGTQEGRIFLWAIVDPEEAKTEHRYLRVAGTGHEIDVNEKLGFIGTVHMHGGSLVFHIFEWKP